MPHQYVTGYRSGQTARLALQRQRGQLLRGAGVGLSRRVEAQVIEPGIAIPVYVDLIYNGESLSNSPQVKGLAIPAFQDLYRMIKGKPPSGQLWDIYCTALAPYLRHGRLIALLPQAPEAAVAALRNNGEAQQRPGFRGRSDPGAWLCAGLRDHPDVNRLARQTPTVRPETRAFVADYIKRANR